MFKLTFLCLVLLLTSAPNFAASSDEADADSKTLLWPDGTKYVGGVKDGKRSGKGTIFWQDGTRFVGTFVDDLRHGPGSMILPDGTVYNGYFEHDNLVQSVAESRSEPTPPVATITAQDVSSETHQVPGREATEVSDPISEKTANEKTITAPPALPNLTVDMRKQIEVAIDAWARAWSNQDVDEYLAAYGAAFEVPGRQSRRQWEGLRRARLTRPSRINVTIAYDTFEVIGVDQVQVDFNQVYDSNLFSDRTNKRLVMIKEGETWKILRERSI